MTPGNGRGGFGEEEKEEGEFKEREREGSHARRLVFRDGFGILTCLLARKDGRRVEGGGGGKDGCELSGRFSTTASAARHGSMEEAIALRALSASSRSGSLH